MIYFKHKLPIAAFFAAAVLYMELVLRIFTCKSFFTTGLLIIPFFCIGFGLMMQAVCMQFLKKTARKITIGVLAVLFLLFGTQAVYHGFFGKYLIAFSFVAGGADQVLADGIVENTLLALASGIPALALLSVPIVLAVMFFDRTVVIPAGKLKMGGIYLGASIILQLALIVIISLFPNMSVVQNGLFDPNLAVSRFGLLRTEVLDIKYNFLGIEQTVEIEPETSTPKDEEESIKPPEPNVMDFDFAGLAEAEQDKDLKLLNSYFAEREPTYKNEYTGMYKGYNLVSVVAEGFSPYAIDPVLTPTLYKMQQEGFKFTNFYTPIWGVSTSDGEYTACTGLIPKSGVWSFYRSADNYMPFCLGNMFGSIGVQNIFAYHNNTHSYYHRDLSHPNMGYNYKGMGTGVEKYVKNVWPQSDLEMIAGSVSEYVSGDKPFHAYYMTVSGHLNYTKIGNSMASKNWEFVKDLNCSENLKAYYACNIELDRAIEKLLAELNAAGVADKTVISITPDHYPYGLERDDGDKYAVWREILGRDVETEFELYKSCFLLYCQGTKDAPTVDKYCYSVDILPTILNLFGFDYDSRLLMGSDILSEGDGLVIFSDRSFITEKGRYSTATESFEVFENASFTSEEEKIQYISNVRAVVNNKFKISSEILEEDYYGYLMKK